jgi:hypothetical protein
VTYLEGAWCDAGRDAKPGNSHTGDNPAGDTDPPVRLGAGFRPPEGESMSLNTVIYVLVIILVIVVVLALLGLV